MHALKDSLISMEYALLVEQTATLVYPRRSAHSAMARPILTRTFAFPPALLTRPQTTR